MMPNRNFELVLVFVVGLLLGILVTVVYHGKSSDNVQVMPLTVTWPTGPLPEQQTTSAEERTLIAPEDPSKETVPIVKKLQIQPHTRYGMTWGTMPEFELSGYVSVGCRGLPGKPCKAYVGDTKCDAELPILCINRGNEIPKPENLPASEYQWSGKEVKISKKVFGTDMTSLDAANQLCEDEFGKKWSIAENRDAGERGLVGKGSIRPDRRFWVYIKDQPANCWAQEDEPPQ